MSEKVKTPAGDADERGSKRRLRSIKRASMPAKPSGDSQASRAGKTGRGVRVREQRT